MTSLILMLHDFTGSSRIRRLTPDIHVCNPLGINGLSTKGQTNI